MIESIQNSKVFSIALGLRLVDKTTHITLPGSSTAGKMFMASFKHHEAMPLKPLSLLLRGKVLMGKSIETVLL